MRLSQNNINRRKAFSKSTQMTQMRRIFADLSNIQENTICIYLHNPRHLRAKRLMRQPLYTA